MTKTRYIHISAVDPETGGGGVEQFARDLRGALGNVKFVSYDYEDGVLPWDCARIGNEKALAAGTIKASDVVMADGFYGAGLEGKVSRLISVCHGSYAGMFREYEVNPPPSYDKSREWLFTAAKQQECVYRDSEVVAVSLSAATELWDIYGIDSTIIRNGVDTSVYKPLETNKYLGIVEVAGKDERKGSDIIMRLKHEGYEINKLGYDGKKHERWQRYSTALLPSRYEGGQYAALEAMASGLTVVAYRSGFFRSDVPTHLLYCTFDYYWRTFAQMLLDAENHAVSAREWVIEHADIQQFNKKWKEFLDA